MRELNNLTVRIEPSEKYTRLVFLESPDAPHPVHVVESNNILGPALTRLHLGSCAKCLLSKCDPVQLDRVLLGLN